MPASVTLGVVSVALVGIAVGTAVCWAEVTFPPKVVVSVSLPIVDAASVVIFSVVKGTLVVISDIAVMSLCGVVEKVFAVVIAAVV